MSHWIDVFRYEVRDMARNKAYLFVTFGIPLLAIVIFLGYREYQDIQNRDETPENPLAQQAETDSNNVISGYVDLTPDHLFPAPESYAEPVGGCAITDADANVDPSVLIKRLGSPYCVGQGYLLFDSFEEGRAALKDGSLDVLYVIEPDYLETGNVSIYFEAFSITAAESSDSFDNFLLASMLNEADPDTFERLFLRLRNPAAIITHKTQATGESAATNQDKDFLVVYGFGLIMMLSLTWGGGYLMQSVVKEKESRVIEIILSSVPPVPLLLGKILAKGLMALIQMVALFGAFVFIAQQAGDVFSALGTIEFETSTLVLVGIYFVLGFLLYGSLMAAIGALTSTMRESQNLVTVVTLPAALPFFFLSLFIDNPNGTLPLVLSMVPITAPLSMVMRVAAGDVPLGQILISIALLVVGIFMAIWFAGRLFRVNTLLRGNTPRLRDIPTLLRG